MMVTTTLFNIVQSELIKMGNDEFETDVPVTETFPFGKFVYYDEDYQFTEKILKYDEDVYNIVDTFFYQHSLDNEMYDKHFKKMFLFRFMNRQINKQTVESFKFELLSTFLMNQDFINRVYADMDKYITQSYFGNEKNAYNQTNNQETNRDETGKSTNDGRNARSDLPQSEPNLNVDDYDMAYPSENDISRSKQANENKSSDVSEGKTQSDSDTDSTNRQYLLDELFKTNGLMESILNTFDKKCFMQIW